MRDRLKGEAGQMTIELAVALPMMLIVVVIAVNALMFFSECASFDRIARQAVRVCAVSPAAGESAEHCAAAANDLISGQIDERFMSSQMSVESAGVGLMRYTATLSFKPTLFGYPFRGEVFGVSLAPLTHETSLVVDTYKPGLIV